MEKNFLIFKNGQATSAQTKPFFFELAMEGYLADNPGILSNPKLMLEDPEVMAVEEVITKGHRIDILLRYANDSIAVVELKNIPVDDKALQQLLNYLQIKKDKLTKEAEGDENTSLIGILVGPEIDETVIQKITNNSLLQGFIIFGMELQRYYDEGNWYTVTNWYAPKSGIGKRDYTKYILNDSNILLGKGRLVYEVVKDYLANHVGISFTELQKVFPDSLRNVKSSKVKLHVVDLEDRVFEFDKKNRYVRYFKEPLICEDGAVVVSSQWGIGNINPFIEYARSLGYIVKEVKP